jgi:hypothetical protein
MWRGGVRGCARIPSSERVHKSIFSPPMCELFQNQWSSYFRAFVQVLGFLQRFPFNFRKMVSKLYNFFKNRRFELGVGSHRIRLHLLWKALLIYIIISYPILILGFNTLVLIVQYSYDLIFLINIGYGNRDRD